MHQAWEGELTAIRPLKRGQRVRVVGDSDDIANALPIGSVGVILSIRDYGLLLVGTEELNSWVWAEDIELI